MEEKVNDNGYYYESKQIVAVKYENLITRKIIYGNLRNRTFVV